ncbi:MAG TPA: UDP binding domain-containing protein, partial [Defluviitoga tunisiensis]|nr:UDP binding domain-containing protein [Defluviitoga tunisiensis]HPU59869.1 UDP binding domain-containing protein [Defluviitoga tunisiensis]
EQLENKKANVLIHDPYVKQFKFKDRLYSTIDLTKEILKECDAVIITTGHKKVDYEFVAKNANIVFDTRNATKNIKDKYPEKIILI